MTTTITSIPVVWCINWTEYESGWGQRPDGCTIHPSVSAATKFKYEYESASNDYSCFVRGSDATMIHATPEMIELLEGKDHAWLAGKRFHNHSM